ncbi:MAG: hypothetical protein PQJ59_01005 [Spirochaetales bacterium]|nr:hypothetical protein [Spirochaetales bacterium]
MKILKYLALILFVVGAVASCDMFSEDEDSLSEREECLVSFFSKAQSEDWDSMYLNLHPTEFTDYDTYKSGSIFNTLFDPGLTYSGMSESGSTVTVTVDPLGTGISDSEEYYFAQSGDDWLITGFTYGGTGSTGTTY